MRYFRWTQNGDNNYSLGTEVWYIEKMNLLNFDQWDLKSGRFIEDWDVNTTAYFSKGDHIIDFPFSAYDIPIYSPQLVSLMESFQSINAQYLPIKIVNANNSSIIHGYCIANYLDVIDCLDRDCSAYELWTKENLLYWEERPWMLNTFRDVGQLILDTSKIDKSPLFRLKGWEVAVIVREDIKESIDQAKITGCVFSELETS